MGTSQERQNTSSTKPFSQRVVGISGTFNVIHRGHEALLKTAFEHGDLVLIGLTTDEFACSTRGETIRVLPFEKRKKALRMYLNGSPPSNSKKYSIIPLGDSFGPAVDMREFHALVVSPETEEVGRKINALREKKGLPPLELVIVLHVLAEDGLPISSTRILEKEIDRDGNINYVFSEDDVRTPGNSSRLGHDTIPSQTTLLVHTCCAGCLLNISETLEQEEDVKFRLIAYWYNPNIHPSREYLKRRDALVSFSREKRIPLILSRDYSIEEFFQCTLLWEMMENKDTGEKDQDLEGSHLRCEECYRLRLERTAELARQLKSPSFTTTLLSSPYQDHQLIRRVGEDMGAGKGTIFFYRDFRKGFKKYNEEYKKTGLYHQNYCGCLFSERERFYKSISP